MTDLIPIPHDGRKPDWLEDDVWVTADAYVNELSVGNRHIAQAARQVWNSPHSKLLLPAAHWAAPVLRAGLTPWNADLQGDGPPKDYAGGKVMLRPRELHEKAGNYWRWQEPGSFTLYVIGYERADQVADAGKAIPNQQPDREGGELVERLRKWHREMDRSAQEMALVPELREAAIGSGEVSKSLSDAATRIEDLTRRLAETEAEVARLASIIAERS